MVLRLTNSHTVNLFSMIVQTGEFQLQAIKMGFLIRQFLIIVKMKQKKRGGYKWPPLIFMYESLFLEGIRNAQQQ